jgi:hypothetical protein
MSLEDNPAAPEAVRADAAPAIREGLERILREFEQMCPFERVEDIYAWDEYTAAELRALILGEAGQDWAKRACYYGYVLGFFGGDEGEPRVVAARALLAP